MQKTVDVTNLMEGIAYIMVSCTFFISSVICFALSHFIWGVIFIAMMFINNAPDGAGLFMLNSKKII